MKFYKENGVNPLAGCLPMIPQMIVFFSLFSVLRAITNYRAGSNPAYGFTVTAVQSAKKATIFGVHLDDKLLFAHPSPPIHVAIVIALTVCISAATTFMTVRQSAKRGLMQTSVDPDNPMAASQKYMMYIVPFFSLTGLYWQFGLVLYWVTTNVWTLGQQFFMFRNWEPPVAAGAAAGGSVAMKSSGAAKSPSSGAARSAGGAKPSGAAKPSGGVKPSGAAKPSGAVKAASGLPSRSSSSDAANGTGQNGTGKRGLLRLGRAKPEPEPVDDVPVPKVVRQQPQRQARSKRSGKR
jgi:YidC/Oxa1 family membrane protein insertase